MDALYIIGGIVLFVLVIRSNTARKRDREDDRERLLELSSRISDLEQTVRTLEGQRDKTAATRSPQKPAERPTPEPQSPPLKVAQPQPVTPDKKSLPVTSVKSTVSQIDDEIDSRIVPQVPTPSVPSPLTAASAPTLRLHGWDTQTTFADRVKSSHDLEERLGTNWLNKLGIGILVWGSPFFWLTN